VQSRLLLTLVLVGVFLTAAASADGKRFEGYTRGYIGPDHSFHSSRTGERVENHRLVRLSR
jgi:hypothetical protein